MGAYLGNRLSREGHDVVMIDQSEAAFDSLAEDFGGFKLVGDATEVDTLHKARIEDADLVVAATQYDNVNLMIAQIAKRVFNVPLVLARVFDPKREEIYRVLGVETVCPTTLSAERVISIIRDWSSSERTSR